MIVLVRSPEIINYSVSPVDWSKERDLTASVYNQKPNLDDNVSFRSLYTARLVLHGREIANLHIYYF